MNKNIVFYVILVILLTSCNQSFDASDNNRGYGYSNKVAEYTEEAVEALEEDWEEITDAEQGQVNIEQQLVKTGNVTFETQDMDETQLMLDRLIILTKAYTSNQNEYKSNARLTKRLTIRLPSINFDIFLDSLSNGVAYFDRKDVSVEDVTSEFIDVQARLKTKKELEQRYIDLLSKANKVSEILEIEREIGKLRADIESFEGRLKYLRDQVSLSTIHLEYYKVVRKSINFWTKISQATGRGWGNLLNFMIGIFTFWPFVIIFAIGVYLIKLRRKSKHK
jgi:hypothetical protein